MLYIMQALLSFGAVFIKGFQQQNVIGGNYKAAFFISYLMAVFEVSVISLVVLSGWSSIIPVGAGASLGIVSSMYFYRKLNKR